MTTTGINPQGRRRSRRKLRPLVISLDPPGDGTAAAAGSGNGNSSSRREQITRMFEHPSLSRHFEPPAFSPGVPQRDLRNRLRLLEHAHRAGLIPEVEWEAIRRAVREHRSEGDDNCAIDPFRYLATTTKVRSSNEESNDGTADEGETKSKKKNRWREHQTKSLVPLSPRRQGSAEDRALPYSVELWRKAKTLNRDRSVLACTLAHLIAMRTLVGEGGEGVASDGGGGFDFILEDNVRAFVGAEHGEGGSTGSDASDGGGREWTGRSCECSDRIWDAIEASEQAPSECHLRYYGWLGSAPNLNWIYAHHIPRSAFDGTPRSSIHETRRERAALFPFPATEEIERDVADANCKTPRQEKARRSEEGPEGQPKSTDASSQTPRFATPGGTAVWGAFAYAISPASYRTLLDRLRHDVGSLMWKGKRMRAYRAKPVDKILPRHVASEFGPGSVHLPARVAFVRAPMLGSLLHPRWEEGFCNSTELQHRLSRGDPSASSGSDGDADGADVWDRVWLAEEEVRVVNHRKSTGEWIQRGDVEQAMEEEPKDPQLNDIAKNDYFSPRSRRSAATSKVIPISVLIAVVSLSFSLSAKLLPLPLLPGHGSVDAFAFNGPIRHQYKRPNNSLLVGSSTSEDDIIAGQRKKAKLGKVPIISRTIPIELQVPLEMPKNKDIDRSGDIVGKNTKRLDVTVWEMDKPSDLIQEWWSIDASERSSRVGDPFGVVMWPGSILASKELMKRHYSSPSESPLTNATVLVLGAGTGVEAQAAALLGAKKVVATDINPLTLRLLEYGAENDDRIVDGFEARKYDMYSSEPLPPCDILVAADVLYNPDLAKQVGRRLHEAIVRSFEEGSPPTKVIITDSQKFHGTNFLEEVAELRELNAVFREGNWEELKWEVQTIENVCGSGVLVDEDQIYDAEVRMICWGWE